MLLGKESNMKSPTAGAGAPAAPAMANTSEGEKKSVINQGLWQACAGPLVNLPAAGTHVVYFPQGHSEQVAASMKKDVDAQIPNYPNLPSKLLCLLHSVTLHADPETDEVYAQMTLQPVPSYDKDALLRSDLSSKSNKPQTEFFCKTLTASDTSTHGGFSVPRRAAEKIFPALDFTMQPPAQELMAKDLHDNIWTFRHIYRGQPKRHLLTTGWSLFVSGKRLFAGDSVLFIRDEKQQLLLGIRRANRQPTNLSSSVLSSDSMHIGILAAAAHAAANNSPFTVFYNPRASPSEFVIPLAKYYKAVYSNQISLGMRFRMMFETEESGTRRYMGTITGISDLDPVRWKNSQWRNLQVGWDESTAGERRNRVSIWEIEPVTAPFFICPTPSFFRPKRPRQPGMPDEDLSDLDGLFKRTMPWLGDDFGMKDPQGLPGLSLVQWMNMQQQNNPPLANASQPNYMQPLQNLSSADITRQLGLPPPQLPQQQNVIPFNVQRPPQQQQQQMQQLDQLQKLPAAANMNPMNPVVQPQQQLNDLSQQNPRQNLVGQSYPAIQAQSQQGQLLPGQNLVHVQNGVQQQSPSHQQFQRNVPQNLPSPQPQQPPNMSQNQQQNELMSQHLNFPDNQIQMQLLQKLHHQQQSMLAQQSAMQQQQPHLLNDQQKQLSDAPQSFSRSITSSQTQDTYQTPSTAPQQMTRGSSQNNIRFTQPSHQPKLQHQQSGVLQELHGQFGQSLPPATNQLSAAGGQSAITDDIPSCSTSPSTNNCQSGIQQAMNERIHHPATMNDDLAHPPAPLLNSTGLENMSGSGNFVKDLLSKSDVKPSVNIAKNHNPGQGFFGHQPYLNASGAQLDYLDSSSSVTSVCLSQNDGNLPHATNQMSFNSQPVLFREASQEVQVDPRHNLSFGANMDNQFGMPMMPESVTPKGFSSNLDAGAGLIPTGFDNAKEAQPELSSSMVSQSFGVPDMTFNSIDSTINDSSFMNRGTWGAPQLPRLRTFTKVYKRGAVGRSIDIARYSGYEELKQDLARRFGLEGQLEDRQRIGWKLVYVDHENDVLLVGDDPWEEFVNCVRCIKILSPQEVEQMSLDGDFGNNVIPPHQACSSSDGGNV